MEMRALLESPVLRGRAIDPDAALVAAAREEPQAFLALYDRYFDRILGYVRLRIRDESTCEDVTSTVFTSALAQLRRFRGDGMFAGWLFQIARNAVRDAQRKPSAPWLRDEARSSEPDLEERFLAFERPPALADPCASTAAAAPARTALRSRPRLRRDRSDRRRRPRHGARAAAPDSRRATTEVSP